MDLIAKCALNSRPGEGKFDIDDIDPNLCTHGFYGFADLDNITWTIYPYDPWFDLAPEDCEPGYCNYNSYRRFIALKEINPNFIPMLSIGKEENSSYYIKRRMYNDTGLIFRWMECWFWKVLPYGKG